MSEQSELDDDYNVERERIDMEMSLRLELQQTPVSSFAVEVIADGSGKWCGNGLRFETRESADAYGLDLAMRWTAVRDVRTIESDMPFNRDANGNAVSVPETETAF